LGWFAFCLVQLPIPRSLQTALIISPVLSIGPIDLTPAPPHDGRLGTIGGDHACRPWQISGACVSRVLRPIINGHDSEAYIRDRLREAVDVLRRLPYPCGGAPRGRSRLRPSQRSELGRSFSSSPSDSSTCCASSCVITE